MTLTPSVRAISLCSFPCVARSFACASFETISTLECLLFLAIAASLRPPDAANFYCALLQGNALFPCRFRNAEETTPEGETDRLGLPKKTDDWRLPKKVPTIATIAAPQD